MTTHPDSLPVRRGERPIDELVAGDEFRKTLLPRADAHIGGSPTFYGWAIMEGFLAGIDYARRISAAPSAHASGGLAEEDVAEIRKRHDEECAYWDDESNGDIGHAPSEAHFDRGKLLAVLSRQSAELARMREALKPYVTMNPSIRGGRPCVKGTGFTLEQLIIELRDSAGLHEVADNFDLDEAMVIKALNGASALFNILVADRRTLEPSP